MTIMEGNGLVLARCRGDAGNGDILINPPRLSLESLTSEGHTNEEYCKGEHEWLMNKTEEPGK